jgi:hypothetical protein
MSNKALQDALNKVLSMASSHIQDIESGIEDGTYDPAENADLNEKKGALNIVQNAFLDIVQGNPVALKQSVDVAYWNSQVYGEQLDEPDNGKPFQMDVIDRREAEGFVGVDIGSKEGQVDDIMSLSLEINRLPGSKDDVPCMHLKCTDELVISLYKQGDQYVMRPETGVSVMETVLPNGELGWILR